MTDLLTPEKVRHWQANLEDLANPLALATSENIAWDRNKELEALIRNEAMTLLEMWDKRDA